MWIEPIQNSSQSIIIIEFLKEKRKQIQMAHQLICKEKCTLPRPMNK